MRILKIDITALFVVIEQTDILVKKEKKERKKNKGDKLTFGVSCCGHVVIICVFFFSLQSQNDGRGTSRDVS